MPPKPKVTFVVNLCRLFAMAEAVTVANESDNEASSESTESDYYTSASEESESEPVIEEGMGSLGLQGSQDDAKQYFMKVFEQLSADLHQLWKNHLSTISSHDTYSIHVLQILLDRLVNRLK